MATRAEQPTGSLDVALAHARRLITHRPELALQQAAAVLEAVPGHPHALLLRGRALRMTGAIAEAKQVLGGLAKREPRSAETALELGLTLWAGGDIDQAVTALRRSVTLRGTVEAWTALADLLRLAGDEAGAAEAHLATIRASTDDPQLIEAAAALGSNDLPRAEALLRDHLRRQPGNIAALRMLAEVAGRLGRYSDAERLLAQVLELAPGFDAARQAYAMVLQRANKPKAALTEIDRLLDKDPRQGGARTTKAAILVRLGEYEAAIELYESLLADFPNLSRNWMSYGHALKTVGRSTDAVAAYREAIAIEPTLGEAWWSLANLKTHRFDVAAMAAMEQALVTPGLIEEHRLHLHFALGKAQEDAGDDAAAFQQYASGNAIRREQIGYDPERIERQVARATAVFTHALMAERQGQGCSDPDAIFIVGLPRAGSTLVEQILASHPQVEGTMELPDLMEIAAELAGRDDRYPDVIATLSPEALRGLGKEYLRRTRVQRKTARPFFIDKMPNNWLHAGLIALILPNAKIIDARRHPLDCCFSAWRQHFARGQGFSYGLEDLGRYYRAYAGQLGNTDAVFPGLVHRVIHERLVEDFEAEVRRLLDYCGLPFDPACLSFWETQRAVRTASSEQVRRPINRDGIGRWRRFEAELEPLKAALGPVLETWDK